METKKPHKDPLHGVTLEKIVKELSDVYGWDKLGREIDIKCFTVNPSVKSSLTFLRRTEWARKKVEALYLKHLSKAARKKETQLIELGRSIFG
jgi:uncharacterized protein (DUF2132 family)